VPLYTQRLPAASDRLPRDPAITSTLSGWGRLSVPGQELRSEDLDALTRDAVLTRGLARSYGDSSLPPPSCRTVVATPLADRLIGFDETSGVLRAEAGYALQDLYRLFLPRGWFTPVSPGTQFVTLGGMVAADVHGKNHHVDGTIGKHVHAIRLRVASGEIVECSRTHESDLFRATLGGMGLTGHILEVELQLMRVPSPWIMSNRRQIADVDEFLTALKETAAKWPFTMGWIDCISRGAHMGRGFLTCGRWATKAEAPAHPPPILRRLPVPFTCPTWCSGRTVARIFNEGVYRVYRTHGDRILHPEGFFYPLDSLLHWNRLYGARGMTQHQCVLPESAGHQAVRGLLDLLTQRRAPTFLCVIKDCGDEGEGVLSFPMRGTSIALDLPVRQDTQAVVDALNEYVIKMGGRIYLAKDALSRPEHFRAMEPRLDTFMAIRRRWDPAGRFKSAQSVRLLGDQP
jgi:decaprenylphospho-beta-D-ribofuranose 2-oxidase